MPFGCPPTFRDPGWRSLVILLIYGYQGLIAGFGLTVLPNYFAEMGATPAAIGGYIAMIGLPWILQPLWGPLVDGHGRSHMGGRRSWVLLALAGAVASLGGLGFAGSGPSALPWFGLVLLVHSGFASLLDAAVDAMIIDCVPLKRFGQATALTRTGFVTGTALGALLFSWVLPGYGLAVASTLLMLFGAAAGLVALLVRETGTDVLLSLRCHPLADPMRASRTTYGSLVGQMFQQMRQRGTIALLALCVAEEFATATFGVHLGVGMIQDGGWDAASLSRLQGGLTLVGGTVGALSIGHWSDRIGHHTMLRLLLGACALAYLVAGLMVLTPHVAWRSATAMTLSSIVPALVFVALAPTVMRRSRGVGAATQFALFMAALNTGGILGSAASGPVGAVLASWQIALGGACIFLACTAATFRMHILVAEP
ncbi:MFS transporter [Dankookia sp. GCM10030260]|uniref:MFS transporter n=1 Tax=Dankookia sp. GCM10030260 TaxID=3273390 RepID=UPI00360990B4